MNIHILTLFPEMFKGPFEHSIIKRAQEKGLVKIELHNLRDWATDKHRSVDDKPYGGGKGMILRVDVIDRALRDLKRKTQNAKLTDNNLSTNMTKLQLKTILLTPQGKTFSQAKAKKLSKYQNILFICGHYEGFDERVRSLVDEEISIGEYVLTGGELPAMVITDTIARLIPDVLPEGVTNEETFSTGNPQLNIEYPQYTIPRKYKDMTVPKILLGGDHGKIKKWRVFRGRVPKAGGWIDTLAKN